MLCVLLCVCASVCACVCGRVCEIVWVQHSHCPPDDGPVTAAYPCVGVGVRAVGKGGSPADRALGGGALGGSSHHTATYTFLADDKAETPLVDDDTVRVRACVPLWLCACAKMGLCVIVVVCV